MFELIIQVVLTIPTQSIITKQISLTGACLDSLVDETVDLFCKRVQKTQHCKVPKGCKHKIKPTDGCCPVCGKPRTAAMLCSQVHTFAWVHQEQQSALQ